METTRSSAFCLAVSVAKQCCSKRMARISRAFFWIRSCRIPRRLSRPLIPSSKVEEKTCHRASQDINAGNDRVVLEWRVGVWIMIASERVISHGFLSEITTFKIKQLRSRLTQISRMMLIPNYLVTDKRCQGTLIRRHALYEDPRELEPIQYLGEEIVCSTNWTLLAVTSSSSSCNQSIRPRNASRKRHYGRL